MKKSPLFLLFLLPFFSLYGEVFSLWPLNGSAGRGESSGDLLSGERLWDEKVVSGGKKMTMQVSMVPHPLPEALNLLRKRYPKAFFAVNQDTVLMERTLSSGSRERVLLVAVQGVRPVLSFTMILPKDGLGTARWYRDFPLPPGAEIVQSMDFPARKAHYGAFTTRESAETTLSYLTSNLTASGWTAVSNEHKQVHKGTGEVFIRNSTKDLLIIGMTKNEKTGILFCSLYMRRTP